MTKEIALKIEGMDCPSCAGPLEKAVCGHCQRKVHN